MAIFGAPEKLLESIGNNHCFKDKNHKYLP